MSEEWIVKRIDEHAKWVWKGTLGDSRSNDVGGAFDIIVADLSESANVGNYHPYTIRPIASLSISTSAQIKLMIVL